MPDQDGLQLLPQSRRKIDISVPGENRFIFTGAIILFLAIILLAGLMYYKNTREQALTSLDGQITALESQRDKATEGKIVALNQQIGFVSQLLSNHVFWSKGLERFGGMLNPQVYLESLAVSTSEQKMTFQATAPNYSAIARQIAAFVASNSVVDVTLGEIKTLTAGKLEFSMILYFDRTKLLVNE